MRAWKWTGLAGKTLWDWLQLLVIPLVLAGLAFGLDALATQRDHQREDRRAARDREIAVDARREEALRTYVQQISDLLLHERPASDDITQARNVARTQTLTVLPQLDGRRKGLVVRFLFESGLLSGDAQLYNGVRLRGADLRHAVLRGTRFDRSFAQFGAVDWRGADFRDTQFPVGVSFGQADLRGADFSGARMALENSPSEPASDGRRWIRHSPFIGACLSRTRFSGAELNGVSFDGAHGHGVDLSGAALERATFRGARLGDVNFAKTDIQDALLPARPTSPKAAACNSTAFRP